MKKSFVLCALCSMLCISGFAGNVRADIHIALYYANGCTFSGWAKEFINETLVYEYPTLHVSEMNIDVQENQEKHSAAATGCNVGGGVPLAVINGTKCIYGFGPREESEKEYREAMDALLTEDEMQVVAANRTAMAEDADAFRAGVAAAKAAAAQAVVQAEKDRHHRMLRCHITGAGSIIILVAALVLLCRKKKPTGPQKPRRK